MQFGLVRPAACVAACRLTADPQRRPYFAFDNFFSCRGDDCIMALPVGKEKARGVAKDARTSGAAGTAESHRPAAIITEALCVKTGAATNAILTH